MNDWPSELTIGSLREWPGPMTAKRKRSQFGSPLVTTLSQLRSELRLVGATNVELLIAVEPGQFRLDGRPRAGAKVQHPGIVLAFDTVLGRLSYPCDTFTAWEDNLRAVTLALEALRKVDRYGVTKRGEQYRGFLAIEQTTSSGDPLSWLLAFIGGDVTRRDDPDSVAGVIRAAKRKAHPDTGGDAEMFQRVLDAERALRDNGASS